MFGDDVIDDMCATPSDSDDDAEDCEHGTDVAATGSGERAHGTDADATDAWSYRAS